MISLSQFKLNRKSELLCRDTQVEQLEKKVRQLTAILDALPMKLCVYDGKYQSKNFGFDVEQIFENIKEGKEEAFVENQNSYEFTGSTADGARIFAELTIKPFKRYGPDISNLRKLSKHLPLIVLQFKADLSKLVYCNKNSAEWLERHQHSRLKTLPLFEDLQDQETIQFLKYKIQILKETRNRIKYDTVWVKDLNFPNV
jgi:polyhydroxyalkanoate synthesis regulator phasin